MKSNNWSVTVDETEFQELFKLYWYTTEGSRERLSIINEFNKYVYFYIINRFVGEFDMASDFFMEIMSQMKKIIEEYEPSYGMTGLTYLRCNLKRRFFNYKLKVQKIKSYENVHEFYEINSDVDIDSVFEPRDEYLSNSRPDMVENLHSCMSMLKSDEEIAIKLYFCFPLSYHDLRFLVRTFPGKEVVLKYREYLLYIDRKIQSEKEVRENIFRKLYFTNLKIQHDYKTSFISKRKRLVSALYDIKNPVPLRLIAEILHTNVTSVHRKVKRARKKLESLLSGQFYLQFEEYIRQSENTKDEKECLKKAA